MKSFLNTVRLSLRQTVKSFLHTQRQLHHNFWEWEQNGASRIVLFVPTLEIFWGTLFSVWIVGDWESWTPSSLPNFPSNSLKPGFHYPSWRPELTGDRVTGDGRAFPLAELTGRGHPSTRPLTQAVNSGSGNRAEVIPRCRPFVSHQSPLTPALLDKSNTDIVWASCATHPYWYCWMLMLLLLVTNYHL